LKVPRVFRGKYRRVLLKGEAFFEVERNVDNPFVVNTNETLTKVLGTSFNIEGEDARVKVYVNTGKVAFWHKKDKKSRVYLGAGDQGVFNKQKHTLRKLHADDKNIIAWKTGKVFFDNTPLIEVLNILEEHYDVKFKYQQEALKTIALTAKFDQAPLGEVIEIIEFSLDIKITRIKDDKYLVSTN
jgi:ferric-dicitrate binding protein FerR (iron transport regulator)